MTHTPLSPSPPLVPGVPPRWTRHHTGAIALALLLLQAAPTVATDARPASAAKVAELMQQDLLGAAGKEALMITVTYGAGAASLPHRHDAQVFVYVLEGEVTMQLQGHAPASLHAGQTFYEGPDDIHQVSANASGTAPAKILVFMIKDKGKPVSRAIGPHAE